MQRSIAYSNSNPRNTNTYKINQFSNKDNVISYLKSEIFEKEQNALPLSSLQSKYRILQNDLQYIKEEKIKLQNEFTFLTNQTNIEISKLKSENENILKDLNEKTSMNKKLYIDNSNFSKELESYSSKNQELEAQLRNQINIISTLNEEKDNCEQKIITLSYKQDEHEGNIRSLNSEIVRIEKYVTEQKKVIDMKTSQNEKIVKDLESQRLENKNLIEKIKSSEDNVYSIEQQIDLAIETKEKIANDLNDLKKENSDNNREIAMIKKNFDKEIYLRQHVEENRDELEVMLNEKEQAIKRLTNETEELKGKVESIEKERDTLKEDAENYQKRMMELKEENEKLSKELDAIQNEDMKLLQISGRSDKIGYLIAQNKRVVENAIVSLENFIPANRKNKEEYEVNEKGDESYEIL